MKTVGQLTQAVSTLTDQQESFLKSFDRISHQIYAALAILLPIGAILTFFSKGINDVIVHYYLGTPAQQVSPQSQH